MILHSCLSLLPTERVTEVSLPKSRKFKSKRATVRALISTWASLSVLPPPQNTHKGLQTQFPWQCVRGYRTKQPYFQVHVQLTCFLWPLYILTHKKHRHQLQTLKDRLEKQRIYILVPQYLFHPAQDENFHMGILPQRLTWDKKS